MSILQISKKAATQAEVRGILEGSYALEGTLGIPTCFLRSDELLSHYNNFPVYVTETFIESHFERFFLQDCFRSLDMHNKNIYIKHTTEAVRRDLMFLQNRGQDDFSSSAYRKSALGFSGYAHSYDPEIYEDPLFNVVILPRVNATGEDFGRTLLGGQCGDVPGVPEYWHFMTLWHEVGHGSGAGDPQADSIGATMFRKTFDNQKSLACFADIRGLDAIFSYNKEGDGGKLVNDYYGYPMVEAIDYVRALPEKTIDALTEDQVKNIRFQKFNHLSETVREVGALLKRSAPEAFDRRDFSSLDKAAKNLVQAGGVDENAHRILTRFRLACQRLHYGTLTYEDDNDLVDPELLESERAQPITFVPEYLPR